MSLGNCLADLQSRQLISDQRAEELRGTYDELVQQYEGRYGRSAAESMATEKTLEMADLDAMHKKRQALLQVKAQGEILANSRAIFDGGLKDGRPISGAALLAQLARSERGRGIKNVELQTEVIAQQARKLLFGVLGRFRRGLLGSVRHKAELRDIVGARFGEKTDDLNVKEISDAIGETFEWLRSLANAAGARINRLDDYGLPQSHDGIRVGQISRQDWVNFTKSLLGRSRMIDRATGSPMSDARLQLMLEGAYENIVSDGTIDLIPSSVMAGKSMGNRRSEHRVLHFKDADSWLAYNERFGSATPLESIWNHVDSMAHEIASMQVLGPNPDATVRWMRNLLAIEANRKGNFSDRAAAKVKDYEIEKVWNELAGKNRAPVRRNLALAGSTVRNWNVANKLGFAVITALSDHATRRLTSGYNGLPVWKQTGAYLKQVNPFSGRDRAWARRHLIVADELVGGSTGFGRFHIDDNQPGRLWRGSFSFSNLMETNYEFSRRLSEASLRVTLLSGHTIGARETGAREFVAGLSHHADLSFSELPKLFAGMLERHGFGEGKWDQIRGTEMQEYKGMDWLYPENIKDSDLRDAVLRAMYYEVDLAVPTSNAHVRSILRPDRPGTIKNELIAGAAQFKMFPVMIQMQQASRMMAMTKWSTRAAYATALLGSTTVMGALSVQLYELLNGRHPLPMNEWGFVEQAMLKAGGLGIYGDAIKLSENEHGQDLTDLIGGPQMGTVQNVSSVGWSTAKRGVAAATGDEEENEKAQVALGRSLRNLMRREAPLVNSFYTKLAYERFLVDWISELTIGEPIEKTYRRQIKYAEDRGTGYFVPPGGGEWRAPDFGNALGQPAEPVSEFE